MTSTDRHTLLSFIARRYISAKENAATDALRFILNGSEAARAGFTELLREGASDLRPVVSANSRVTEANIGIPDLACSDVDGHVVALVESKFWAPLTAHQPASYWRSLRSDIPSVLLVIAPPYRVASTDYLWGELVSRLRQSGFTLGEVQKTDTLVHASSVDDQRHLVLTTWNNLFDRLTQRVSIEGDQQASFELAQLRGLAANVIENDDPRTDDNLKRAIAVAIQRICESRWGNTSGLGISQTARYYGNNVCLAGAFAWLGIDYRRVNETPGQSLWLSFYSDRGDAPRDKVRELLGNMGESGSIWSPRDVSVRIQLPEPGADCEAVRNAIVAKLETIGRMIDQNGPTYIGEDEGK